MARFLLAPPLVGLARITGLNEKKGLVQLSSAAGTAVILRRISQEVVAHCTRVAFEILLINVLHGGCLKCGSNVSRRLMGGNVEPMMLPLVFDHWLVKRAVYCDDESEAEATELGSMYDQGHRHSLPPLLTRL